MTVCGSGPEIILLPANGLKSSADLAVAAHVIPIAIDGLPAGPDLTVAAGIIAFAVDCKEFGGHRIGVMAVFGGCPEIVVLTADGLETGPDLAVAAHVIFIAIDGLPAGRHDAVFVKIVLFTGNGSKSCSPAFSGIHIVGLSTDFDPAGPDFSGRVVEPLAGYLFPAAESRCLNDGRLSGRQSRCCPCGAGQNCTQKQYHDCSEQIPVRWFFRSDVFAAAVNDP